MTIILNGTTGVTFPDGQTQDVGVPDPGTAGNVLTSNGTAWTSVAAAGFPTGTVLIFAQTSAPTGWTKNTSTGDNSALRVVTGTASSGGSVDFTTAFVSQAVSGTVGTSGATTLSTSQIPSHTHGIASGTGGNTRTYSTFSGSFDTLFVNSEAAGGGGSHTHAGGTFTGTDINLAVKYVDVIRATKD